MKPLLHHKPGALKKCFSACIPLLFLAIANQASAAGESPPPVSATNCLSSLVNVRDNNGNSVMIDPALLQQNRLFRGGLVTGSKPGTCTIVMHPFTIAFNHPWLKIFTRQHQPNAKLLR